MAKHHPRAVSGPGRWRLCKRGKRDVTRETILEAARQLYASGGYDAVSMREIAQRMGFSPQAIYNYFPSKEKIFLALEAKGVELLLRLYQVPVLADPLDEVRLCFWRFYEFGTLYPEYFMMLYVDPTTPDYLATLPESSDFRKLVHRSHDAIARCMTAGIFPRGGNVLNIGHRLMTTTYGSAVVRLTGRPFIDDLERVAADALDTTIDGLRAQAASPSVASARPGCGRQAQKSPEAHLDPLEDHPLN